MDDFRLTAKQIATLKALHRKQRDRRFADRLKAIVLLGSGWSVAEALLIDETPACHVFANPQAGRNRDGRSTATNCDPSSPKIFTCIKQTDRNYKTASV